MACDKTAQLTFHSKKKKNKKEKDEYLPFWDASTPQKKFYQRKKSVRDLQTVINIAFFPDKNW